MAEDPGTANLGDGIAAEGEGRGATEVSWDPDKEQRLVRWGMAALRIPELDGGGRPCVD